MRISDWSSDVCSSDLLTTITYLMQEKFLRLCTTTIFLIWSCTRQVRKLSCVPGPCSKIFTESLIRNLKTFLLDLLRKRAKQEIRSEESSVGKECVSTCRSRRSP